ncbi:hypothetical protein QTJ16_001127 [Diplocarpon rosae]|uniref:ribonuclease H n=1 Tax=Diplocarpon rosae TaxID=946125 RepID=A0AAD9T7I3_9HELO|nr:hypothetical protein QTJ16_001127 [Diplocarpon rosae]
MKYDSLLNICGCIEYAGTSRSLLVFTDGACSNNGNEGARGGLGVFFGPGSRFNLSERVATSGVPTNQKAELEAVARALEAVRNTVIPHRPRTVINSESSYDYRAVCDMTHMRLIIATDSSYVVECLCKHMTDWSKNKQGALVSKQGQLVENSQAFLRLQNGVEELSMVGVQVANYHVGRVENKEADGRAKASIPGDLLRSPGRATPYQRPTRLSG